MVAATVPAMHKKVNERTAQDQQIWQRAQQMGRMALVNEKSQDRDNNHGRDAGARQYPIQKAAFAFVKVFVVMLVSQDLGVHGDTIVLPQMRRATLGHRL